MMIPYRKQKGQDFDLQKKIYARIREEIFVTVNKRQSNNYRLMLSHRPVSGQTLQLYCNGAYLFNGEKRDFQVEGQYLFVKSALLGKGENSLLAVYDYLADL